MMRVRLVLSGGFVDGILHWMEIYRKGDEWEVCTSLECLHFVYFVRIKLRSAYAVFLACVMRGFRGSAGLNSVTRRARFFDLSESTRIFKKNKNYY